MSAATCFPAGTSHNSMGLMLMGSSSGSLTVPNCFSTQSHSTNGVLAHPPHEPDSGTGILPVWADRLEALFHYARAVVVQGFNARNSYSENSHPDLLPRGEGTAIVRFRVCKGPSDKSSCANFRENGERFSLSHRLRQSASRRRVGWVRESFRQTNEQRYKKFSLWVGPPMIAEKCELEFLRERSPAQRQASC